MVSMLAQLVIFLIVFNPLYFHPIGTIACPVLFLMLPAESQMGTLSFCLPQLASRQGVPSTH